MTDKIPQAIASNETLVKHLLDSIWARKGVAAYCAHKGALKRFQTVREEKQQDFYRFLQILYHLFTNVFST